MIMRFFIFLIVSGIGFAFLLKTRQVMDFTGANYWVERVIGRGQSYTVYKILGAVTIFLAFLYLIGDLDGVIIFLVKIFIPGTNNN